MHIMKIDLTFFKSKVARRVFTLFVLCALVPISALAVMSFTHVTKQLERQSQKRLHQSCKALGMSIFERLSFLEQQLSIFTCSYKIISEASLNPAHKVSFEGTKKMFKGMALVTDSKGCLQLFGDIKIPNGLSEEEKHHLRSGKLIILTCPAKDNRLNVYMLIAADPRDRSEGTMYAEIDPMYLWGLTEYNTLPSMTELCVLDQSKRVIFTTLPLSSSFNKKLAPELNRSSLGQFEWKFKEKGYLASFWSVPLKFKFFHSKWIIVMSTSKADILSPMVNFKTAFGFVLLLTFLVVIFLSTIQIRRSMRPIELLRNATQKIAQGVFDHRVIIKSGDEFESLGKAFNQMSKKIKEGQALLVQAAKLSAIGQMAAGIIHEVKQPLTAIYALLELSLMEEKPGKTKERLESILGQVQRLNNMLQRFKSFSYMSEEKMERLSLFKVIVQMHELFDHQFQINQIQCQVEGNENLPDILGDRQGLQQVFSNLFINAVDALGDRNDGQRIINIRTYSSDGKVSVEVQDNGCGIPEEIQERIFDPFFTTKDEDKGTGLGMAIIESILHKHQARIEVESEVGAGTRITLVFSAFAQEATQPPTEMVA
ncbi:MAG: HAMP domain-containing histidine kinase [Desulfobacteraceae bacterium]|nr:MAG: HAMP domain-containing histidine kinase [Desulfobacteraceae bacterium]